MNNVEILALLTFVAKAKNKGHSLKYILEQYATAKSLSLIQAKNNYYIALNKYKSSKPLQDRLQLGNNFFDYTDFEYFNDSEIKNMIEFVLTNTALGKSVRKCMFELSCGNNKKALRLINKYRSTLQRKEPLVYSIMLDMFRRGKAFINPYTNQLITPRCSLTKLANLISPNIDDIQIKQLVARLERLEKFF